NDLCIAAVVAAAIFFVLGDRRVDVVLAGVAVGLALGTKVDAVLALPIIAVVALAAGGRRRTLGVAVSSAAAFAAFGAYIYVLNLVETGRLLGDPTEQDVMRAHASLSTIVSTSLRVVYRFVDLSGLQSLVNSNTGALF